MEVGGHYAPDLTFNNNGNDRASACDEYINPLFASVPGCTDAARGTGSGWKAEFDNATGLTASVAVGRKLLRFITAELEYVMNHSGYNQVTEISIGSGVNQDKLTQEIFLAREVLGDVTSHSLMLNGYASLARGSSAWAPYVGAGVGLSRVSTFYTSTWYRNPNINAIRTGEGLPNAHEIRANLVGTMSNGNAKLQDQVLAWQVFAGMDYRLSETVSLGLRIRRVDYGKFDTDNLVWDPLRSHAPNVRLDGSEPVNAYIRTSGLQTVSAGVVMRYHI